jgi:hypothetical protein
MRQGLPCFLVLALFYFFGNVQPRKAKFPQRLPLPRIWHLTR